MLSSWGSSLVVLVSGLLTYHAYSVAVGLRKNLGIARSTGFPYVIVPWSPWSIFGQLTAKLWEPVVTSLPRAWWEQWIDVVVPNWAYTTNYKPFSRIGDTHLLVSPYSVFLNTANAEMIRQVAGRREHFPKKLETYDILRVFGDNVVTTEGPLWRMHRRVTAASFSERNTACVFAEAIRQARSMVADWVGRGAGATITTVEHDTMRLAMNIIGYAGFGLRLLWPGEALPAGTDPRWAKYGASVPPPGHTMSFVDAVAGLLDNMLVILMAPHWLLRLLPLASTKKTMEAYDNYLLYMDDILADKREAVANGERTEGLDLIGQLVGSQVRDPAVAADSVKSQQQKQQQAPSSTSSSFPSSSSPSRPLTKSEIIGNLFIMLVAGHETSANALHFSLVELAARPSTQRQLQRDLDSIFGGADPDAWPYDTSVNALSASMVGAAANETLRKMPPVVEIPKGVALGPTETCHVVVVDGKRHAIPDGVNLSLVISAVQRNPRYWPTQPSEITGKPHDLDDWVPERWFRTLDSSSPSTGSSGSFPTPAPTTSASTASSSRSHSPSASASASPTCSTDSPASASVPGPAAAATAAPAPDSADDLGGFRGPDTSASLFRPERGAFIPFSEGPRACLGRRVAQVEILATLAVVFRDHSIELAVDQWASDDEVAAMSRPARAALYARAQEESRRVMLTAGSVITLKLHGGFVPVRLVKRGEERFVSWMD